MNKQAKRVILHTFSSTAAVHQLTNNLVRCSSRLDDKNGLTIAFESEGAVREVRFDDELTNAELRQFLKHHGVVHPTYNFPGQAVVRDLGQNATYDFEFFSYKGEKFGATAYYSTGSKPKERTIPLSPMRPLSLASPEAGMPATPAQ